MLPQGDYIHRKNLTSPPNLRNIIKLIRNDLAGNFLGTTRDEKLAEQMIFLLFCKIEDEQETSEDDVVLFQCHYPGDFNLKDRIYALFKRICEKYPNLLTKTDNLILDEKILFQIVKHLENYSISDSDLDSIGGAFEIFLGPSLRGDKGQFFTPNNVARTLIQILDPKKDETFIDPACGSGGFILEAVSYIYRKNNKKNIENNFFGIDKDEFLVKISKIYLKILGLKNNNIFCENSLDSIDQWSKNAKNDLKLNHFDVVCTNPPFGSKIPIKSKKVLEKYLLGYKWNKKSFNKEIKWERTSKLHERQPPQILFIERCIQFLKPGGRMGIVLPDGIFGNPSYRYVMEFLMQETKILAIISCPHLTFLPYTHTKTSLLFLEKTRTSNDYQLFLAIAKNIGHDKNGKPLYRMDNAGNMIMDGFGNPILNDDFPEIIKRYRKLRNGTMLDHSHLGFSIKASEIKELIFIPEYYNPEIYKRLSSLKNNKRYDLYNIGDLEKRGIISINRGHEIGSKFYGTGNIPFIRTSDLINWEINIDPKKLISQEVYENYKEKQDLNHGDILLVCDGTFLIGKTAMLTVHDTRIVIQSHIRKIRVIKKNYFDEYLFLWALNTPLVQLQIKAKTFIQATISTLGNRLQEVIIPIPKDLNEKNEISNKVKDIIDEKMDLKVRIKKINDFLDENI